ncbi:unnamed protein product [Camellia sinensis]
MLILSIVNNMNGEDGVMKMMKRAEIDTRAPFGSVKEAVMLFGERVLAGHVYSPNKLKEMQNEENGNGPSEIGNVTAELEETKQSLQKAKQEGMLMATCLSSLQEELERTKRELHKLKERESEKQVIMETEIDDEDIKFVEDSTKFEAKSHTRVEFQKKRYVTFANPPSFAKVMVPQGDAVLQRHPSLRKKEKKPLIPLIRGIFSRKKGGSEVASL